MPRLSASWWERANPRDLFTGKDPLQAQLLSGIMDNPDLNRPPVQASSLSSGELPTDELLHHHIPVGLDGDLTLGTDEL
ncbi:hypothetical protein GW17_00040289 [Ensete ventricosum]|nr:hypothetical protein GW17_00040289 [Ensete ventricosum]